MIDVDSTICEVAGKSKHGAGYGYTKVTDPNSTSAVRNGQLSPGEGVRSTHDSAKNA